MVDFHGWAMPLQYSSIMEENLAVRENVGIFDICHMGEAEVKGPHSLEFLQYITPNDLSSLEGGMAQYTTILNETGGIIDDLLVYKISDHRFFLCLNAANTLDDVNWMAEQALLYPDVEVRNLTSHYGLLSVQGPNSEALLKQLTKTRIHELEYYHFSVSSIGDHSVILFRFCYTGEDGFEIFCDWRDSAALWKQMSSKGRSFGLKPIGLGARDMLRLEMGYPLHGQDISQATTPYEAGLGWTVKLGKEGGFIGFEALEKQKEKGVESRLVCLRMIGKGIPRAGFAILSGDETIGEITSGTMSPTLGAAIGMGYVDPAHTSPGTKVWVDIRGKKVEAEIKASPQVESKVKKGG